jgi:hypothetical protein
MNEKVKKQKKVGGAITCCGEGNESFFEIAKMQYSIARQITTTQSINESRKFWHRIENFMLGSKRVTQPFPNM